MKINELKIVKDLYNHYENLYSQWRSENPGKIMCNYGIKLDTLSNIIDNNLSLDKIIEKEKYHRKIHDFTIATYGTSGHFQCAEVLKELIDDIKNNKN